MTELSRRTLLLGGGALAVVSTAAIAANAASGTSAPLAGRSPASTPGLVTRAAAAPVPTPSAAALGTVPLSQAGEPAPLGPIAALATPGPMQDVVSAPAAGSWFVTQSASGSNGARLPYETTIINRVRAADGVLLDAMVLVDAGHGLGFEAEVDGGTTWIWITWHGAGPASDGREQDFVRLRYTPGAWTRQQANEQLGLALLPFQDRTPEAVYHFDWSRDRAVERHFNPPSAVAASTETYVRRRISDLRSGVDDRLDEILLRATPPTTQGFATVNDTLFRWLGSSTSGGTSDPSDPITLEQYSWSTGQLVDTGSYAGLWQPWEDGTCEPEGLSVQREADGTASLVLGLTTGRSGHHRYRLSTLRSVGTA